MKDYVKIAGILAGVIALTGFLVFFSWKFKKNEDIGQTASGRQLGDDVVATYAGGEITAQELRTYINKMTLRYGQHEVCEKHNYEHGKCDPSEKCETHPLDSADSYRLLLRYLIIDKMTDRWIREKGMLAREDVTHRLKHLVEEINLGSLSGKMHSEQLKPDRLEMQQYYESHKEEYQNRQFADVEKEIEKLLIAQKQADYIPKYIEELKKNAVIERNYELLKIPEPTDAEIRNYYEENLKEYVRAEAVSAQYMTFQIGGNEKVAREKAEKALSKVRAGGEFGKVAEELGVTASTTEYLEKGKTSSKSAKFLETVFRYQRGEVTPVFKDGETLCIARIADLVGSGQRTLDTVRGDVKSKVYLKKERAKMEENKYEALFSVHGKRFTVQEFMREFDELPAEYKTQFASFDAKKNLLDQMVVKELLMEKGEDQVQDKQEKEYREDAKRNALEQMLHKEEVDEKISIPDNEVKEFYEKNKELLQEPTKAKVSFIRVTIGSSDDERKKAKETIEKAQDSLRSGTDFATVAKKFSDDWSASQGGEIDQWIYEGASRLAEYAEHGFHEYVFALKPGETSNFFEFQNYYMIVKLREREDARPQTLDEAKPNIVKYLNASRHEERTLQMENELMEKSELVIRDSVLSRLFSAESKGHSGEPRLQKESRHNH
ncbi:MAG TPA: hypothetical protein DCZ94_05755 [Lentisphaeria bacterium]|nr:MAG: hypothetical protein A2X48_07275 [Lentisphaerae bacterium GWF2_49_21]HBC86440.1 hypothetical protein [Lentisphaeria bacterium]